MSATPSLIAMQARRNTRYILVVSALSSTFFFLFHQMYVSIVHPDVLYMDSLRHLFKIDRWEYGHLQIFDVWNDSPVHKGLIMQAFLLANVELFDLDALLANRLTGAAILLCCLFTLRIFWKDNKNLPFQSITASLVTCAFAAITPAIYYGLAGFEVMTLDMGLPLWTKNLMFLIFFALSSNFLRNKSNNYFSCAVLCVFSAAIIFFAGMGWSYPFALSVAGLQLLYQWSEFSQKRVFISIKSVPAIFVLFCTFLYTMIGNSSGQGATNAHATGFSADILLLPFYSLGSSTIGVEVASTQHGAIHCAMLVGILIVILATHGIYARARRGLTTGSLVPIYMIGYGFSMALATALARGSIGAEGVMASRYYMDVILTLIGTLWLLAEAVIRGNDSKRINTISYGILVACCITGHVDTTLHEWRIAPFRRAAFAELRDITRRGVIGENEARLLQSPQDYAQKAVSIMHRRRLSVFGELPTGEKCAKGTEFGKSWHAKESNGMWMGKRASIMIAPCDCPFRTTAYLPTTFASRDLLITESPANSTNLIRITSGKTVSIVIPASTTSTFVEFEVSKTTLPARDIPGQADQRELGVFFGLPNYDCVTSTAPN